MSKQIGRKVEAAIGIEATRGTGVSPAFSLGKVDFSLLDKTVDVRDVSSIGRIEDSNAKYVVEKYAQGAIGGMLGANSALYLLTLALGATPSVSTIADSRYPWTLTTSNTNQHKSASLHIKDLNQQLIHKLVMLNELEISVKMDEAVTWKAEFVSKVGRTSTASFPSYVEDYKFTKRKSKVYLASDVSGLAAATRSSIKEISFKFVKNLVKDSVIGTVEPTDIQNQQLAIEGQLKLNYNDATTKALMLDGTYKALRISMESEKLIGATSYGDLTIDLSKVDFFQWEQDSPNDEIVSNTIQFKANYDLSNGMVNAVSVRNALSTT
jgi:hypothetical protein